MYLPIRETFIIIIPQIFFKSKEYESLLTFSILTGVFTLVTAISQKIGLVPIKELTLKIILILTVY